MNTIQYNANLAITPENDITNYLDNCTAAMNVRIKQR